jgi:hypothetical protein
MALECILELAILPYYKARYLLTEKERRKLKHLNAQDKNLRTSNA